MAKRPAFYKALNLLEYEAGAQKDHKIKTLAGKVTVCFCLKVFSRAIVFAGTGGRDYRHNQEFGATQ